MHDDRVATPRSISQAYDMALKEDAVRSALRAYAADHTELLSDFLQAILTDDQYGAAIARRATQIMELRARTRL
jgi:hypothetical protein